MNLPGVTIITPTLNSQRTIGNYIKWINYQKYPKNKLEVLILDGGSSDQTLNIINKDKKIKVKIFNQGYKSNMEARKYFGFVKAKYNFLLMLDSDNYLYDPYAIKKLIYPFLHEEKLTGSFSLHYHYLKTMPLFTRYISLFGNHDPVAYYLNKADRQKFTVNDWPNKTQVIKKNSKYTLLEFSKSNLPTVGCNGFVVQKNQFDLKKIKPTAFMHTDIMYDLLDKGLNKYAVVDTKIIHDSSPNLLNHLKKRFEYMNLHHISLSKLRRYKVFDSSSKTDWLNLFKFSVYSLTIVVPLGESVEGFVKYPDIAWFLHPVLCIAFMFTYGLAILKSKLK